MACPRDVITEMVLLSLQLPLPAEDEGEALVLNAGLGVALEEPGGAGGLQ